MSRLSKWSVPALTFAVIIALAGARAGAQQGGATEKAKPAKVTGVVHDEQGKPVANATVRVTAPQSQKKEGEKKEPAPQAADDAAAAGAIPLQAEETPAKKPERPKPVAEGKTNADGKFEIEVATPGKYTIMVNMRGMGRVQKTTELKAGETTDLGTLVLKPQQKKEAAPKEETPKKEPAPTT